MECPICYEEMKTCTTLNCGHKFHTHCINRWAEEHCTCPYCRFVFKFNEPPRSDMCFMMLCVIVYTYFFLIVALHG